MNKEQAFELMLRYSSDAAKLELNDTIGPNEARCYEHMVAMPNILTSKPGWSRENVLERLAPDKVMRWLGFMQGAFWALDQYSIDDLREHVIHASMSPQKYAVALASLMDEHTRAHEDIQEDGILMTFFRGPRYVQVQLDSEIHLLDYEGATGVDVYVDPKKAADRINQMLQEPKL